MLYYIVNHEWTLIQTIRHGYIITWLDMRMKYYRKNKEIFYNIDEISIVPDVNNALKESKFPFRE
mgnify:CR=1 FL=1